MRTLKLSIFYRRKLQGEKPLSHYEKRLMLVKRMTKLSFFYFAEAAAGCC
jgi:hypothetical protein